MDYNLNRFKPELAMEEEKRGSTSNIAGVGSDRREATPGNDRAGTPQPPPADGAGHTTNLEGRLESCRTRCGIEPGPTVGRRRALSSGGGTVRRESPQSRINTTEAQPFFLPVDPAFRDAFSFPAFVKVLAGFRAKTAATRHERFFAYEILADAPHPLASRRNPLDGCLPSRKQCRRPRRDRRKGRSSQAVLKESIVRTVLGFARHSTLETTAWGRNLLGLYQSVQARIAAAEMSFAPPRVHAVPKPSKPGQPRKYRAIVEYGDLADRVILALAAGYLCAALDPEFRDESHAFRDPTRGRSPSHHRAIQALLDYQKKRSDHALYAADCDIRSFFDSVGHDVVRESLRGLERRRAESGAPPLDPAAIRIIEAFLASYRFAENGVVAPDIVKAYAEAGAEAPNAPLSADGTASRKRVGIPQGGALSPILANAVLDAADRAVVGTGERDPDLYYARFCDDVLFVHQSFEKCLAAMNRYRCALAELDLPAYTPKDVLYGSDYFEAKTKGPYPWGRPSEDRKTMPWVGFVGYQIRWDGQIRLRKSTIDKQIDRLAEVTAAIAAPLKTINRPVLKIGIQEVYLRAEGRMISLGVGRSDVRSRYPAAAQHCWFDAFPLLEPNYYSLGQMKILDWHRERQLSRLRRNLERHSMARGEWQRVHKNRRGAGTELKTPDMKAVAYRSGKPTSYVGRLQKQIPLERRLAKAPPAIQGYGR